MPDLNRLKREVKQCRADTESNVTVEPIVCHLTGCFKGPEGTCYEGGTFNVDIVIPDQYPFKPPKMKFTTLIYHPNISSQTGAICLDILKDAWTPLISLQSLLCDAAPDDPQDAQVARHYISDRPGFEATAREWTRKYATGIKEILNLEEGLDQPTISRLSEMGFERSVVVKALRNTDGNEQQAIELLLQ